MSQGRRSGKISYRDSGGHEIGREWFSIDTDSHGKTFRAVCEMDEKRLLRDTNWTTDSNGRPIDGFVRVRLRGEIAGTNWFKIDGKNVRGEGWSLESGPISQHFSTADAVEYLGLHPVIADASIASVRGYDKVGQFIPVNTITCSYAPDGESGLQAHSMTILVAYHGRETINVEAGNFDAHRYSIKWQADWPAADLWVDEESILLKLYWSFNELRFELVESF